MILLLNSFCGNEEDSSRNLIFSSLSSWQGNKDIPPTPEFRSREEICHQKNAKLSHKTTRRKEMKTKKMFRFIDWGICSEYTVNLLPINQWLTQNGFPILRHLSSSSQSRRRKFPLYQYFFLLTKKVNNFLERTYVVFILIPDNFCIRLCLFFKKFLLNKEKKLKKRKFSDAFFPFSHFFSLLNKNFSKIILYKRGKGVTQTFPMPSQDDCFKFLLHKRKKLIKWKKVHFNEKRSSIEFLKICVQGIFALIFRTIQWQIYVQLSMQK